jgi:hypothetical protein
MKKALLLAFLSSFAIQFILVDAKYVTDSANVISNEAELERAIDDFYMYSMFLTSMSMLGLASSRATWMKKAQRT